MPLMELVLEQSYFNQQCINRWNYMATGTPSAVTLSFALLSATGFLPLATTLLADTIGGTLQELQAPGVTFVQATARAVYLDDDFYGNAFLSGTAGLNGAGGNDQSPVDAWGFRSSRVKQSIGRGYKRFVGVPEGHVGQGGEITPAGITFMNAVKDAMSEVLAYTDEGNSLSFAPCIVQKEKYVTDAGNDAYKYYATELLQAPHIAQGIFWENYTQTRSQVSRQYGRGS